MNKNKSNLILTIISIFPFVLSLILFNSLISNPHTKISGNNGIELNKVEFLIVIAILSIVGYMLSGSLSKSIFFPKMNPIFLRFSVNIAFALLLILLIVSNLK